MTKADVRRLIQDHIKGKSAVIAEMRERYENTLSQRGVNVHDPHLEPPTDRATLDFYEEWQRWDQQDKLLKEASTYLSLGFGLLDQLI